MNGRGRQRPSGRGRAAAGAGAEATAAAGAPGAFTMLSIHTVLSRKVVPDLALLIRTPLGSFSLRIWPWMTPPSLR